MSGKDYKTPRSYSASYHLTAEHLAANDANVGSVQVGTNYCKKRR